MASFIKLDSTNLVQDGYNSSWRYSFPGSSADFQDVTCAVQSISMYNSEYNIDSSQFLNNSFKIEVPTAGTTSTVSVTLQDGLYTSGDILSAFDRGDAQSGQLIAYRPSQYAWMNCQNGSRVSITITLFNQNDTRIKLRDTSVSIMLLLRPKK
eukprot:jgi/Phyca11/131998/e_gw1.126.23.1